jgi:glycine cleavage system transcriptional repressor
MRGKNQLVLVALSSDRVGLVAQITGIVREQGGNVEDSRMAALGSEFGIMLLVSGTDEQLQAIESNAAARCTDAGMSILARRTMPAAGSARDRAMARVTASALDHEGIVHAVADAIQRMGVSIATMQTTSYPAPLSGAPQFRLDATLELPIGMSVDTVRAALAGVAERENLDVNVRESSPESAGR